MGEGYSTGAGQSQWELGGSGGLALPEVQLSCLSAVQQELRLKPSVQRAGWMEGARLER